jgi:hypothetical protein
MEGIYVTSKRKINREWMKAQKKSREMNRANPGRYKVMKEPTKSGCALVIIAAIGLVAVVAGSAAYVIASVMI